MFWKWEAKCGVVTVNRNGAQVFTPHPAKTFGNVPRMPNPEETNAKYEARQGLDKTLSKVLIVQMALMAYNPDMQE